MNRSGEYTKGAFKTLKDWHIYYVYNDPDFIEDAGKLDLLKDDTSELRKKYGLNRYDLFFWEVRKLLYLSHNLERKGKLVPNTDNNTYTLTFDIMTTKAEFLEFWEQFSRYRDNFIGKPKVKRKPPEHPDLIYAVFKAKQAGSTFPEIFRLCNDPDKKLPGFNGELPAHMDAKKLQEYYNKFKPVKS